MTNSRWQLALVSAVLAAGCARTVAPMPSRVDMAHCGRLADSLQIVTPFAALPLVTPIGRPTLPPPPPDARAGVIVHTVFAVRPDGTVDTATVASTGTGDLGYQRAMRRALARVPFNQGIVSGCPVWARGDIQRISVPGTRARPAP